MTTPQVNKNLLALDIGQKRIGLALASNTAKLPRPLLTIENNDKSLDHIKRIVEEEQVGIIIVGLPRNLSGQDTEQTNLVRTYGQKVASETGLKIHWQDEALTSKKAEDELNNRGVSYNKEHIDALAATYILEDFLSEHQEVV